MELQKGDNFLSGLNNMVEPIYQNIKSGIAQLSNPNIYPESKLGQAGNYVSAMLRNGVPQETVEEFLRQYQFGNKMPGVGPQQSFWQNFLSKGNIGLEDIRNLTTKMGTFGAGAIIPPFLEDIANQANKPSA